MNKPPYMLKCDKTHDSGISYLVGSSNFERRGVADTSYADPSPVGAHTESRSTCTYSLTRGLCYAMHVRRYIMIAMIYALQNLQHI